MEAEPPKRRFQFSLRTLFLLVVAASFALAAMRYSTTAWTTGVVTFTVLFLLGAIALAVSSRIDRRPFWIGFAVCGCGYLVVVGSTGFVAPEFVLRLATTKSVEFLRDKLHPWSDFVEYQARGTGRPPREIRYSPGLPLLPSQAVKDYSYQSYSDESYPTVTWNFLLIGQCVWALILGTLGGTLARFAADRSRSGAASESSTP